MLISQHINFYQLNIKQHKAIYAWFNLHTDRATKHYSRRLQSKSVEMAPKMKKGGRDKIMGK